MPALEPLRGLHVVADPGALDAARWTAGRPPTDSDRPSSDRPAADAPPDPSVTILRFAPDEAFAIGARDVQVADPDAIVVDERGFVGAWCSRVELGQHIDWPVPEHGPVLAQGAIAGVPAKLWIPRAGDRILLVAAAPYEHELSERLGWAR